MFNYPMAFMSSFGHATNLSFPNMMYSGVLPTMYTNYGGDLQVTNMDPYGGYNLGLMFNPIAQQTWGMSSLFANNFMTNPSDITAAAAQQAQSLLTPIYTNMTTSNISQATQAIQSSITKLESNLAAEGTKEEEKTLIQQTIDKLKEQAEKLDALKEECQNMDLESAFQKSKEILKNVNDILKEHNEGIKAIVEANKQQDAQKAEEQTTATEEPAQNNQQQGVNEQAQEPAAEAQTSATEEPAQQPASESENIQLKKDARSMFTYINSNNYTDVCKLIDSNIENETLVDLMFKWDEEYSSANKKGFIGAFREVAKGQAHRLKYYNSIVDALCDKAESLGMNQDEKMKKAIDTAREVIIQYSNLDKSVVKKETPVAIANATAENLEKELVDAINFAKNHIKNKL